MQESRLLMGMPVTVEIRDAGATPQAIQKAFSYFQYVDEKFSTYKPASEISKINGKKLAESDWSDDMKLIMRLSAQTKRETDGYFDIRRKDGYIDPSGIVKGWAIHNVALILQKEGFRYFYVDAGGDIQVAAPKTEAPWRVGIRNPFKQSEIVQTVQLRNEGIATSGTYLRGDHIYNPRADHANATAIASLTVIGPNIYDADRFATAAFAMGKQGIMFIENLKGFEGYMIDTEGIATETGGFAKYKA
ncbi:MAG: FAD:protein FMN transferase [Patescibacteria group bacterium]|nr:FAD:protein FMN transferase [Patescibacteria group bacterium]